MLDLLLRLGPCTLSVGVFCLLYGRRLRKKLLSTLCSRLSCSLLWGTLLCAPAAPFEAALGRLKMDIAGTTSCGACGLGPGEVSARGSILPSRVHQGTLLGMYSRAWLSCR